MAQTKPNMTRVWAESAPPTNIEDPDVTTPGKWAMGWIAETPGFENFNYLQQYFTQSLTYLNEQGIARWDANTTYPIGAYSKGSNNTLYVAKVETTGDDPTSSPTEWEDLTLTSTYSKSVIDNKDTDTLQAAKDYTYAQSTINSKDTTTLNSAKAYTYSQSTIDGKDSSTLSAAQSYVGGYTYDKSTIDSKDSATLSAANAYTDSQNSGAIISSTFGDDGVTERHNGTWIKYPDGTMIISGWVGVINSNIGAFPVTDSFCYDTPTPSPETVTFPEPFVGAKPVVVLGSFGVIRGGSSRIVSLDSGTPPTLTNFTGVAVFTGGDTASTVERCYYTATGRWK